MGYRSDVVCIMYAKKDDGGQAIVNEWVRQRIPKGTEDCFIFEPDLVTFKADQWKWHEDMSPVKDLLNMFAEFREAFFDLDEDKDSYAQEFARVGEALDDAEYEVYGASDYRLCIQREITID